MKSLLQVEQPDVARAFPVFKDNLPAGGRPFGITHIDARLGKMCELGFLFCSARDGVDIPLAVAEAGKDDAVAIRRPAIRPVLPRSSGQLADGAAPAGNDADLGVTPNLLFDGEQLAIGRPARPADGMFFRGNLLWDSVTQPHGPDIDESAIPGLIGHLGAVRREMGKTHIERPLSDFAHSAAGMIAGKDLDFVSRLWSHPCQVSSRKPVGMEPSAR